MTNFISV